MPGFTLTHNPTDNSPVTNVNSTDFRCNAGGLTSASATLTSTVAAGSVVGLALDQAIYHNGVLKSAQHHYFTSGIVR
jgi:hypothetical protein